MLPNNLSLNFDPSSTLPGNTGAYKIKMPELTHDEIVMRPVQDRFRSYYNDQRTRQDMARDDDATSSMAKDLQAEQERLAYYRSMLFQQPPQMPAHGQLNQADVIGAAVGGLATGHYNDANANAMASADARNATQYQNAMQNYQVQNQGAMMDYNASRANVDDMRRNMQSEQAYQRQLQDQQAQRDWQGRMSDVEWQRQQMRDSANYNHDTAMKSMQVDQRSLIDAQSRIYQANTPGEATFAIRQYNQMAYNMGMDQIPDDVARQIVGGASETAKRNAIQMYQSAISKWVPYGSIPDSARNELEHQRQEIIRQYGVDPGPIPSGTTTSERGFGLSQDRTELDRQRLNLDQQKFEWSKYMDTLRAKTKADADTHAGRSDISKAIEKSVDAAISGFMATGTRSKAISAAIETIVRGEQLLGSAHPTIRNAYARLKSIGVTPDMVKTFTNSNMSVDQFVESIAGAMGHGEVRPLAPGVYGPIIGGR